MEENLGEKTIEKLVKWARTLWKHELHINLEKDKILKVDRNKEPKSKMTLEEKGS